ncbi:hypothetical protein KAH94_06235, partial [bacterium]|nr:hypothetical protein [bacterium]
MIEIEKRIKKIEKFHKKIKRLFPDCVVEKGKTRQRGSLQSLKFNLIEKEFLLVEDHTIAININSLVNTNIVKKDAYNRYRVLHCSFKSRLIYKIIK